MLSGGSRVSLPVCWFALWFASGSGWFFFFFFQAFGLFENQKRQLFIYYFFFFWLQFCPAKGCKESYSFYRTMCCLVYLFDIFYFMRNQTEFLASDLAQRSAADQILRELQNNPDTWLQVVHILQNSQSLNTKFFALQVSWKQFNSICLWCNIIKKMRFQTAHLWVLVLCQIWTCYLNEIIGAIHQCNLLVTGLR